MVDISLHLLDLMQNGANAGATAVSLEIVEDREADSMRICVRDNGRGMDPEEVKRALDPFYTSHPGKKVGLGLPLAAQAASMAGGSLKIQSSPGHGTEVLVEFKLSHIDRQPLGDLASTVVSFLAGNPGVRVSLDYRGSGGSYTFDSAALRQSIENSETRPLSQIEFLGLAEEKLRAGLAEAGFRPDGGGLAIEIDRRPGKDKERNPG